MTGGISAVCLATDLSRPLGEYLGSGDVGNPVERRRGWLLPCLLMMGCVGSPSPRHIAVRNPTPCPGLGRSVVFCQGAILLDLTDPAGVRNLRRLVQPDHYALSKTDGLTLGVSGRVLRSEGRLALIADATKRTHVWVEAVPETLGDPSLDDDDLRRLSTVEGIEGIIIGRSATVTAAAVTEFIHHQPELRVVRLSSNAVDDGVVAAIATLTDVRQVSLSRGHASEDGLMSLASSNKLESLELYDFPLSERSLGALSQLQQLRALKLATQAEGTAAEYSAAGLTALGRLPRLTTLTLEGWSLFNTDALLNLEHLHTLDLSNTIGIDQPQVLEVLAGMSGLQRLDLSGSDVEDIRPLGALASLEELDLSHTNVSSLEGLASLERLRRLEVDHTAVHPTALSVLANLPHLEVVIVSDDLLGSVDQTSLPLYSVGTTPTW